jgi:hypothetical protein
MRDVQKEIKLERVPVYVEKITCDKCGITINPEDWEGDHVGHELVIAADQDQCVNFYRRRDYCDNCWVPIWQQINTLIGVDDPYVERDQEYDS